MAPHNRGCDGWCSKNMSKHLMPRTLFLWLFLFFVKAFILKCYCSRNSGVVGCPKNKRHRYVAPCYSFPQWLTLKLCSLHILTDNDLDTFQVLSSISWHLDCLCGLVVRVLVYRTGGPGSIPCTTRKKSSGSWTGFIQLRGYNWGATW
jgi:hypothetical protein